MLAEQGSIVAGYRQRGRRRYGPYFRLVVRLGGRQQSIYLGADEELVREAQAALEKLQASTRRRRWLRQQQQSLRQALKRSREEMRQLLKQRGLRLQGYEVRGWRTQQHDKGTCITAQSPGRAHDGGS